uniref:Uncharacterized protein n=1 Tax=Anguilla anguilla TaxID=7936 RepID=A0A0E9QCK7_ANGAN
MKCMGLFLQTAFKAHFLARTSTTEVEMFQKSEA